MSGSDVAGQILLSCRFVLQMLMLPRAKQSRARPRSCGGSLGSIRGMGRTSVYISGSHRP